MALQLVERILATALARPRACAIEQIETGQQLTWAEVARGMQSVAAMIQTKVSPGSVVMLCCGNVPEFIPAFLGLLRAGMRVFPAPEQSTPREFESAARASAAKAVIAFAPVFEALPVGTLAPIELPDCLSFDGAPVGGDASTSALLLNSSGTTGVPKVVSRSAASINAVCAAMCEAIGICDEDRILATVPLCHSYGVEHGLFAPMWAGASVLLCRGFNLPAVLNALRDRATIFPAVPFMIEAVAQESRTFSPALRKVYSAGGRLPPNVAARFFDQHALHVGQVYGATEIGSVTFSDPRDPCYRPDSVGRAMPGVELQVSDDGLLSVKAPSMFEGYIEDGIVNRACNSDGFFSTGDLGEIDANGNLVLKGRAKLLIDVGGLKVNPIEVEAVISQFPDVAACVVVAMRLSDTVTRLKALVVARPGGVIDTTALRQFARTLLSPHKLPRVFEVRQALPMSASGKVLRQRLQEEEGSI